MTGLAAPPVVADGTGRLHFRPDLEGLRAVAVGLVLAFHAGIPIAHGGFVGVDVFYVLSGFLITGLLIRELRESGTISLPAFYARRARRLLPAASFVLVVTLVASFVLLPPLRLASVAADAVAAALYVANLRFAAEATDYLAATAPSPLLHYWSLAVEEQFYLLWPATLLLVMRWRPQGRRVVRRVALVSAVVVVASFVVSLVLTATFEPWAFFTLPARAWELALGALVAVAAARSATLPARARPVAIVSGLGLIAVAGILYSARTPYPGTAALLPTVGAALVIAGGLGGTTLPGRLLALPPLRWLGRISYSLYLWHWPLISIPVALYGEDFTLRMRVAAGLVAVVLAAITTRWVEDPVRRGRFTGLSSRRTLAAAGVLTVVVAGTSVGAGLLAPYRPATTPATPPTAVLASPAPATPSLAPPDDPGIRQVLGEPGPQPSSLPGTSATPEPGPPARTASGVVPADLQPSLAQAKKDLAHIYSNGCHADHAQTVVPPCGYGVPDGPRVIVLVGDSHAASWFPTLERIAVERGWRLVSLTKSSCAVVDHAIWSVSAKRPYAECDTWRTGLMARLAELRPDLVVLTNSRFHLLDVDGAPIEAMRHLDIWAAAVGRTAGLLRAVSRNVVVIGDTPRSTLDPPTCLSAHLDDTIACTTPRRSAVDRDGHPAERAAVVEAGAIYVDPDPWVCPSEPCPVIIGRTLVYRDEGHLTATFARALAPYLAAQLPPLD